MLSIKLLAIISYSVGGFLFLLLAGLLLTSWRGRLLGGLLIACSVSSVIWFAALTAAFAGIAINNQAIGGLEACRNALWLVFLARLQGFEPPSKAGFSGDARWLAVIALLVCTGSLVAAVITPLPYAALRAISVGWYQAISYLLTGLIGLIAIEQLLRNTSRDSMWALKFLYLGIGGLFAFDFIMYSKIILMSQFDPDFMIARGLVNGVAVPMIAIAAARNPQWSVNVFVSRDVIFHSSTIIIAGFYLLVMAGIGYYLRTFGGTWGGVAEVLFLTAVTILLAIVLFSGRARARLRKFVSENFYEYRYNYREEWLRFTRNLSGQRPGGSVEENAVRAIAQIVESPRGQLWLRNNNGDYVIESHWHMPESEQQGLLSDSQFLAMLESERTVVDVNEWKTFPDKYHNYTIPGPIDSVERIWLVVPLLLRDELYGFVSLTRSRSRAELGWEDRDLLLTVGMQAASYLALRRVSEALAEAKQFEAFSRLSAFVVHDLKNIAAQLELMITNSKRYRDNQEFIDDAFATTENAVRRMNRLLAQLRKDRVRIAESCSRIDICEIAALAVKNRSAGKPVPCFHKEVPQAWITGDRDRLTATIENLIQNAQEACKSDDSVELMVRAKDLDFELVIRDSGCGMDEKFVRERLFRPFDTTKGNAGMGIGVYEAREYVDSLGGSIKVKSVPGEGTEVRLTLPAGTIAEAPETRQLNVVG